MSDMNGRFGDPVHVHQSRGPFAVAGEPGAQAREIERKYARLFEANFWESNPGPAKTILSMMGRCDATVRLPLVKPDRAMRQRLRRAGPTFAHHRKDSA